MSAPCWACGDTPGELAPGRAWACPECGRIYQGPPRPVRIKDVAHVRELLAQEQLDTPKRLRAAIRRALEEGLL